MQILYLLPENENADNDDILIFTFTYNVFKDFITLYQHYIMRLTKPGWVHHDGKLFFRELQLYRGFVLQNTNVNVGC